VIDVTTAKGKSPNWESGLECTYTSIRSRNNPKLRRSERMQPTAQAVGCSGERWSKPRRGERNGRLFRNRSPRLGQMHPFRRGRSYKRHLESSGHAYTPTRSTSSPPTSFPPTPGTSSTSAPRKHNQTSSRPRTTRVRSTKVQRSLIVGLEESNW